MEGLVYPSLLEEIERRLDAFTIDGVLDSGTIEQLAEDEWYSPFPHKYFGTLAATLCGETKSLELAGRTVHVEGLDFRLIGAA